MKSLNQVQRYAWNFAGIMKFVCSFPILIGVAATAFTGIAQAALLYQHQGDANPISEGFFINPYSFGPATVDPITNDQGLSAWSINTLAQRTQYGYSSGITSAQKADIASQGFTLDFTARVLPGSAPAYDTTNYAVIGGAILRTNTFSFPIHLGLDANGDTVVVLPTYYDNLGGRNPGYIRSLGPSYTLAGSGSNYHDYRLVYNPATQLADLFVDGVNRIQGYGGDAQYLNDEIGLGFSAFSGGQANFNQVSLSVGAVPVPAAVWLFGSALVGLFGFGSRKRILASAVTLECAEERTASIA